jgi:hypothetical protein
VARADQAGDVVVNRFDGRSTETARKVDGGAATVSDGHTGMTLVLRDGKQSEAMCAALTGG